MTSAPSVHIRPALPYDRPAIRSVNRRAWQSDYTHIFTPDEIDDLFDFKLQQHGSWVYHRDRRLPTHVAEHGGTIVGFVSCATWIDRHSGEITSCYVLPDFQRRGIGTRLWDTAVQLLRDAHCDALWVWVLERARAREFYELHGCKERKRGIYKVGRHGEVAVGYHRHI